MKKITLATIKSFVRNNFDNLYVKKMSDWCSMDDCITTVKDEFRKVDGYYNSESRNTLGIKNGAWFVGFGRDYFEKYEDSKMIGYEISNCCGRFILAIKK